MVADNAVDRDLQRQRRQKGKRHGQQAEHEHAEQVEPEFPHLVPDPPVEYEAGNRRTARGVGHPGDTITSWVRQRDARRIPSPPVAQGGEAGRRFRKPGSHSGDDMRSVMAVFRVRNESIFQ